MGIGTRGKTKSAARGRRHARLRKKVVGTSSVPRLVVTRSARHVFVQVVDDSQGVTVASASTMEADLRAFDGDKTAKAKRVGELVGERARRQASSLSCSTGAATATPVASQRSPTAHERQGWDCERREQGHAGDGHHAAGCSRCSRG